MPEPDDDADLSLLRKSARDFLSTPRDDRAIADLGWTGLLVPEEVGGAGWRPVEAAVIGAELGRAGSAAAWHGTAVCAGALARWGSGSERERWLPALLDGSAVGAVAIGDAPRSVGTPDVVVACRPDGIVVHSAGSVESWPDSSSMDVARELRRLVLAEGSVAPAGGADAARVVAAATRLLHAADAIGTLAAARERVVDHLRNREAFGQPLASFQALQHRLVDLLVFELRGAAIIARAAREGAALLPSFAPSAAAAHAFVTDAVVAAVDECVQLSGGIGFTWEYPLHRELRRALADTVLAGTARSSRTVLAEMSGW